MHPVNREQKAQVLAWLIGQNRWEQVLVFTRTKHGADKLVRSLESDGIKAVALHGNKSQNNRTRALADFKSGAIAVMVATDIAARGIDIDQLPHVVNYDLPNVPEDYVHRIGRTGRAGNDGEAISLVCVDEHTFLRDIERLIKRSITQEVLPGFAPDPNAVAQTVFTQRGQRPQHGGRGQAQAARGHGGQRAPAATSGARRSPPSHATKAPAGVGRSAHAAAGAAAAPRNHAHAAPPRGNAATPRQGHASDARAHGQVRSHAAAPRAPAPGQPGATHRGQANAPATPALLHRARPKHGA